MSPDRRLVTTTGSRHRWSSVPLFVAAVLGITAAALPASAPRASSRSGPPAWKRYVEAPTSQTVQPVRVVSATGSVSNPQTLTTGHGTAAVLTFVPGGPTPKVVLDYGREVGGTPQFNVTSVSGAPAIRAAFSETLANLSAGGDGTITTNAGTGDPHRYDDYSVLGAGAITGTTIQGGERYETVSLSRPGRVTLRSVAIHFEPYLGTADALRGWFLSSSDLLNRIWYAGVYTTNLVQQRPGTQVVPGQTNRDGLLLDGAKRDRAVWSGDLAVTDPTIFYSLDPGYARASLQLLGEHPATSADQGVPAMGDRSRPGPMAGVCRPTTTPPASCWSYSASYSIYYVTNLYDYWLYTGDSAFLRRAWPLAHRELAWNAEQVDATGLFSTDAQNGYDWNITSHQGEQTYVNALYFLALNDAARMTDALKHHAEATRYRSQARSIANAVNQRLFNQNTSVYDASTTARSFIAQDANVYAVLSGLAPPDRAGQIMDILTRTLATPYGTRDVSTPYPPDYVPTVSPFIASSELNADFETGHTDLALALIRDEWGWMTTHDPDGVDWERIPSSGTIGTTDSAAHGWSTGATSALSRFVLGVAPTSPGFTAFTVEAHPGNLTWAEGAVPTPHGDVTASWRAETRGFALTIGAPTGTVGTVVVPVLGASRQIVEDGRIVWHDGHPSRGAHAAARAGSVVFTGVTGRHTWSWSAAAQ